MKNYSWPSLEGPTEIYYSFAEKAEVDYEIAFDAAPESIDRLDGPEAYDGAGASTSASEPVIRKDFPESWIWDSFEG